MNLMEVLRIPTRRSPQMEIPIILTRQSGPRRCKLRKRTGAPLGLNGWLVGSLEFIKQLIPKMTSGVSAQVQQLQRLCPYKILFYAANGFQQTAMTSADQNGIPVPPTIEAMTTFFGVIDNGDGTYSKGAEQLPPSSDGVFYRRSAPLTFAELALLGDQAYLAHPVVFGTNSGKPNSFTGSPDQLGSVLTGPHPLCLVFTEDLFVRKVAIAAHDMDACDLPPYFPPFLWTYWLSDIFSTSLNPDNQRFHVYDVHTNSLAETRRVPQQSRNVFQDFLNQEVLDEHCHTALEAAEMAFAALEAKAELAFEHLMQEVASSQDRTKTKPLSIKQHELETLRRYFVFIRFRNSSAYAFMLSNLVQTVTWENKSGKGVLLSVWHRIRRHRALTSIHAFLRHDAARLPQPAMTCEEVNLHCWKFMGADISLGIASEGQEFILTDHCSGNLDEAFRDDPESCRFFVPLSPTVALYILGDDIPSPVSPPTKVSGQSDFSLVPIDCGLESVSDIHLRNTVLLQGCPRYIYFSNLLSIAQTIRLYELGSRCAESHTDYSRLMHRSQQKATQEQVTKTLLVKGCFMTDLTDQVVRLGECPVAHGSFSDVWKGTWTVRDPFNQTVHRKVALKYLRQVMPPGIREKLVHRLKDEVVAWHSLRHENIAQLFGVIQSFDTIAMISPWCDNGTLTHYIKDINPAADRLALLTQVASGVSYLHNFKPVVIHGDLKGCNILIDDHGHALLTDFGLAKIIEDVTGAMKVATSFFAGSTRWLAPELILALVQDDGQPPPITTSSDVYAFACVCLEIATGHVPFPNRSNDHAVTVDIMRGVRPCRGASLPCHIICSDEAAFWRMLDQCWDPEHYLRPTMSEVFAFLCGKPEHPIAYTSQWPC
ncbi:hypothetical protein HWV62_20828 [Athelia sp. TMB]|nr:hypothetical protein HWV62_20828 [Athelia sp. TMB]